VEPRHWFSRSARQEIRGTHSVSKVNQTTGNQEASSVTSAVCNLACCSGPSFVPPDVR
jgi:hypothetical protein